MIHPLDRPVARSILLLIRLFFVLVVHQLDPDLLLPALILMMPWLTEDVDTRWTGIVANVTRWLRLPGVFRFRVIVLLMFWPSAVKDMGLAILWTLLALPLPAARPLLLFMLLWTLVSSASLAYTEKVAVIHGTPPRLRVVKEMAYRIQAVHHGVLYGIVGFWLLQESARPLVVFAVLSGGIVWFFRHYGVLVPLVMLVYAIQVFCGMVILTPDRWQTVFILIALCSALLVSWPAIRIQAGRNFRSHRVMKWLERSRQ